MYFSFVWYDEVEELPAPESPNGTHLLSSPPWLHELVRHAVKCCEQRGTVLGSRMSSDDEFLRWEADLYRDALRGPSLTWDVTHLLPKLTVTELQIDRERIQVRGEYVSGAELANMATVVVTDPTGIQVMPVLPFRQHFVLRLWYEPPSIEPPHVRLRYGHPPPTEEPKMGVDFEP